MTSFFASKQSELAIFLIFSYIIYLGVIMTYL